MNKSKLNYKTIFIFVTVMKLQNYFLFSQLFKKKKHLPPAVDQNEAPTNLKWPQWEKDFWWLWKMMVKEFVLFNDATNTIKDQFNSISTWAMDDTGKRYYRREHSDLWRKKCSASPTILFLGQEHPNERSSFSSFKQEKSLKP